MSKKDEALKLALEALEKIGLRGWVERKEEAIIAIREALAEQPAQQEPVACAAPMACSGSDKCVFRTPPSAQQESVFAIRLLTNQCFALIQERDELQKQVWRYEKNGVTCQTYRHKVDASCSECNVHEVYTSPPASKPWVGLTEDEKTEIRREHYARTLPLMDAVEAKLKEKNA